MDLNYHAQVCSSMVCGWAISPRGLPNYVRTHIIYIIRIYNIIKNTYNIGTTESIIQIIGSIIHVSSYTQHNIMDQCTPHLYTYYNRRIIVDEYEYISIILHYCTHIQVRRVPTIYNMETYGLNIELSYNISAPVWDRKYCAMCTYI